MRPWWPTDVARKSPCWGISFGVGGVVGGTRWGKRTVADVEETEDTLAAVEEFADCFNAEPISKPRPNIRSQSIPEHHRNTMLLIPHRLGLRQQIPRRLPNVHKRRGPALPDFVPEARDAEFLAHTQRDAAGDAHEGDVGARTVIHGHWVVEAASVGADLDAEVGGARADAGPGASGVEDYSFWEAGCAARSVLVFLCMAWWLWAKRKTLQDSVLPCIHEETWISPFHSFSQLIARSRRRNRSYFRLGLLIKHNNTHPQLSLDLVLHRP